MQKKKHTWCDKTMALTYCKIDQWKMSSIIQFKHAF